MSESEIKDSTRIRIKNMTLPRLKKYHRKRCEERDIQQVHLNYCLDPERTNRIQGSIDGLDRAIKLCEDKMKELAA